MPRKARNIQPLTSYHIMVQGINKEHIFKEDKYKKKYLSILKRNLDEFHVKLISYCIMINHAHLLFYAEDDFSISEIMQRVNLSFSIYYNDKNDRVGYVFRDRFLSQEIFDYDQLKVCISYIHNNPVKANIVKSPDLYYFSSYNEYRVKKSNYIDFDLISLLFQNDVHDIWNLVDDDTFSLKEPDNYDKAIYYRDVISKVEIFRILKDKELLKRFLRVSKEKYFVPNAELASILNVSKSTIKNWLVKMNSIEE